MKKIPFTLLAALAVASATFAQKLPNKQEKSLWAPADIKIDGTTAEWKNQFQAYNKATDIFYTISNDDKNLYLTVQAKYKDIVDKIIRGGITFAVSPESRKSSSNMTALTYPAIEGTDMFIVSNKFTGKYNNFEEGKKGPINVDDLNELYSAKEKLIKVAGFEGIDEPTISVYNDTGIKAAARFDDKLGFTYELAVPLKYIKLPNNGIAPFKYHITINEPEQVRRPTVINANTPPPPPPILMTALATTDFWGDYTLAKK